MKPFQTLRREIVGAWRSVRYDLDRRAEARADGSEPEPGDAWYTRQLPERAGPLAPLREPRRVATALGVAGVIAASATGTYFAVAGGLGLLIADAAGLPVSPEASAPRAPFAAPDRTGAGEGRHAERPYPVRRLTPLAPMAPAAPVARELPVPPATEVAKGSPGRPGRTRTPRPPGHSPVPESTPTVTPSTSSGPTAVPFVSETPGYPLPDLGH